MKYDKENKNFIIDFKDIVIILLLIAVVIMGIMLIKSKTAIKNISDINQTETEQIVTITEEEIITTKETEQTTEVTTEVKQETSESKKETTVASTTKQTTNAKKVQPAVNNIAPTTAPSISFNAPGVSPNATTNVTQKGWQSYNGKWFYYNSSGEMLKKQISTIDGDTYYFDENGIMITKAWVQYDGYSYYFGADGKMLTNTTTPDGYRVDARGRYIEQFDEDEETKKNSNNIGPGSSSSGPSSSGSSNNLPDSVSYSGPTGGVNSNNTGSIGSDTTGTTFKLGTLYNVTSNYTTANNHMVSISFKLPQITNSSGSANTKFNNYVKGLKDKILEDIKSILDDNDDGEDYIKSFKAEAVKITEQDESYLEIRSTGQAKTKTNETISTEILISYEKDTGTISYEVSSE